MKRKIKLTAAVMAAVVTAGLLSGCGGTDNDTAQTDGKSFSLWGSMDANSQVSLSSYNDMLLYQEMEKRTGVHIDFIHPIEGSTGSESFITMLSGSKWPDIIEYSWSSYTGGPQQAIDDGVLVALNDYLEEHAPNYYDYLEGEKGKANDYLYRLQTMTEEGNYYGFNCLSIGTTRCFEGLIVRGDKLDEWGMNIPETIDEWTAVFAKAKSEGFSKPFTTHNGIISFKNTNHGFNTAFNVGKNFYLDGDNVVFAPFENGYKEYVAQMAEWAKLGYIDTGFVTNDLSTIEGNIANDISIACFNWISFIGNTTTAVQKRNPSFRLVACPYPVAEKGETSVFQGVSGEATAMAYGITTQCGNIEKAIEWCDYIYSDEGSILHSFGVEGDTYTVENIDGEEHYVYTEKITVPENSGVESIAQALYKYMLPANHPGLTQHPDYLIGYYPLESQQDAMELWNKGVDEAKKRVLPTLAYSQEETREREDILEIAESELEVALHDIVLGKKSIDTYEDAIKKAKDNGYDRLIEIEQAAYERYISNLK